MRSIRPNLAAPKQGQDATRLAVLNRDWTKSTIVADSAPRAATPTTIARDRDRLLWVNSQLDDAPGTPPYTVSVVPALRQKDDLRSMDTEERNR